MTSAVWKVGRINPIMLVSEKDLDLRVYIAEVSSGQYVLSSLRFSRSDVGYYSNYTFNTAGDYVLKVVDDNDNIADVFIYISARVNTIGLTELQNDHLMSLPTKTLTDAQNAALLHVEDALYGNWEVKNDTLIMYDRHGEVNTTFRLFNEDGVPTETRVFKRVV